MIDTTNFTDDLETAPPIEITPIRPERGIAALIPNAIDGTGLPKFCLDTRTVHEQYRCKSYVVTIGWALDPDSGRADAAMTLFPERRFEDAGAWVISRRGIMKFCDEHNRPTPHAFEEAFKALPILGYDTTKDEVRRLIDVVMEYVDMLVQAPAPSLSIKLILAGDPIWDVTVHAKGSPNKVLREVSI